jgi:hypothetical protein
MAGSFSIRAPSATKVWLPEDESKLQELRTAGKTWAFIAKVLGRTQVSVESRAGVIQRRARTGVKTDPPEL